jgi:hypothetical protein
MAAFFKTVDLAEGSVGELPGHEDLFTSHKEFDGVV